MPKGLQRSLKNAVANVMQTVTIPINKSFSVADGAPGFGSTAIGALPQGNVLFLGACAYLSFSSSSSTITATFDGDYSIGTAATVDGDLVDANEANIIPSAALGAATAKLSPVVRSASTDALGGGIIDNTAADTSIYINLLIDDAAISGAATVTAKGYLAICYTVLGDD